MRQKEEEEWHDDEMIHEFDVDDQIDKKYRENKE
jgi:hypothetical protein